MLRYNIGFIGFILLLVAIGTFILMSINDTQEYKDKCIATEYKVFVRGYPSTVYDCLGVLK